MTQKTNTSNDKSLGFLRKNRKTKPKSPELIGKIVLQRSTLEKIAWEFQRTRGNTVDCPIAVWPNRYDSGEQYLTLQFSPPYVPPEPDTTFDLSDFLGNESDEPEDGE